MTGHTKATLLVGASWRRLLVLLIGGLVSIPYGAIVIWAVALWTSDDAAWYARWSSVAVGVLLIVPAILPVTRALERTVASQLLDISVPEPRVRAQFSDTARGALFFAGHIASGGILILGIAFVFPLLVVLIGDGLGGTGAGAELMRDAFAVAVVDEATALALGAVASALIVGFTIGACYLLPWYAALLLGPSRDEQRARDAEAASAAQRRGALARDVHDSVGHALTVTTMQAFVARREIEHDPDAARAALAEIERVSRSAVAELDYVLSVLRDGEGARDDRAADTRTLGDVGLLAEETRAAGFAVELAMEGEPERLPASLGREAYRVVQEGVTNALRYAATPRVCIEIALSGDDLRIHIDNETAAVRAIDGRGLVGLRERVIVLGGECHVTVGDGRWRLTAVLPTRGPTGSAA
ncbi:sensor histidine kinase [Paramicrobacterium fandaimingii]|uniref:sensor histidine kinase n=1 Tax=Paramicrobacterium fandaimingii TaxID=2708079 RepID=UPI001421E256|nr:histidine kinase [Microbacterium fandaimingii]